ncbi:uncharacterized protein JCM15063_005322 [Sporobolomyces koalae]|uniref:uncharacterized protein n=1 Tax=Sporobolomyces koalae TaxID=500713 RepID=UPI0031705A59
MDSPRQSGSPVPARDELLDYGPPHTLPLPSGVYSLSHLIDKVDNGTIPKGPFEASDLRKRWQLHVEQQRTKSNPTTALSNLSLEESSAVIDDDDDDDVPPGNLDDEFIVPFFVATPEYLPPGPAPTTSHDPARRRSSSTRSGSFTPMTPIPSLRPSSPTPSASHAQISHDRVAKTAGPAQPIGFLRPPIVLALLEDNQKLVDMNLEPVWKFLPNVSFKKTLERRPSYGSRPGSRRHSIKSLSSSSKPNLERSNSNNSLSYDEPRDSTATFTSESIEFSDIQSKLRSLGDRGGTLPTEYGVWAVGFEDWINDAPGAFELRNEHLDRITRGWRMSKQFTDQLSGWREEKYNIYGPIERLSRDDNPLPGSNVAFKLERAACSLFGVTTFGVHCTAYVKGDEPGSEIKIWVPRRSATKATWPSYLDNTCAGGITAGDLPRQSMLREFIEEASLSPTLVSPRLVQTGVVTYVYRQTLGWLQPEVQYVYELKLPGNDERFKPTTNPQDGEVESFELIGLGKVVELLLEGQFKPNCALVLIDFFIKHGLLTAENDVRFLEINSRIHRELGLPGPA